MYNFPVTRRLTGSEEPVPWLFRSNLMPSCLPVPSCFLMPAGPVHVAAPGVLDALAIGVAQVADNTARYAREEHAGRDALARQHDRAGRDQRARAYPGAAEHDRAHADKRAFFNVGAVHGRVVTQAYPWFQPDRLAGVDVQAAQVLDVALLADEDLVIVGAQDSVVPHARVGADSDGADDDGAGGDPGVRVDRGDGWAAVGLAILVGRGLERSDQGWWG